MQGVQAPAIKVTLPVALDSRDSKRRRWGWGGGVFLPWILWWRAGRQLFVQRSVCQFAAGQRWWLRQSWAWCCRCHRVGVKLESVPIVTADRSVNGESGISLCCESSSADFSQTAHLTRGVDFCQTAHLARGADFVFGQTAYLRVLPWRRCCWGDVPTAFFTFRITATWRQSYECVLFGLD